MITNILPLFFESQCISTLHDWTHNVLPILLDVWVWTERSVLWNGMSNFQDQSFLQTSHTKHDLKFDKIHLFKILMLSIHKLQLLYSSLSDTRVVRMGSIVTPNHHSCCHQVRLWHMWLVAWHSSKCRSLAGKLSYCTLDLQLMGDHLCG